MDESAEVKPTPEPQQDPNALVPSSLLKLVVGEFTTPGNGLIVRTSCKLCNSPFREEAEKLFEERKSIPFIKTFLDGKGLIIAMNNIRHHMNEHYKSMARMAVLAEYCEDLQSLMVRRRDRAEELELLINIGRKEMFHAVSTPTDGDPNRERERLAMVEKGFRMMIDAMKVMNEMENGDAKAKAIQLHFVKVWKDKIAAAQNPAEREMLIATLEDFKRSFDGRREDTK